MICNNSSLMLIPSFAVHPYLGCTGGRDCTVCGSLSQLCPVSPQCKVERCRTTHPAHSHCPTHEPSSSYAGSLSPTHLSTQPKYFLIITRTDDT